MKYINLTMGMRAAVDDSDFDYLSRWKWQYNSRFGYATRSTWKTLRPKVYKHVTIYMHKVVLPTQLGFVTDHIDHNKLNNQRSNLRVATRAQNNQNRVMATNNTSGHKGVHYRKRFGDYSAYISVDSRRIFLGLYKDMSDAIMARKIAETKYHGDFVPNRERG